MYAFKCMATYVMLFMDLWGLIVSVVMMILFPVHYDGLMMKEWVTVGWWFCGKVGALRSEG